MSPQVALASPKAKQNGKGVDLQLAVNLDNLLFGDLKLLAMFESMANKKMSPQEVLEVVKFLNRVVVGGVDHLPISAAPQIMAAINNTMMDKRQDHEKNSRRRQRRGHG
jgi:hypothetical protein